MSKILITGAHGFIGKHLARWLSQHGHQVLAIGHGAWPIDEAASWGVNYWLNADIQFENLSLLQNKCGTPDVVYHLAGGSSVGLAIANPKEDFYRTVSTTAELLEWIRLDAPQTSLVAISSAAVYGANHDGRIPEYTQLTPYSPYGYHKQIMEDLCRSYASNYGIRVCIARLFSVFGAELKKQLLWDLCQRISSTSSPLVLGGTGDELRDWTDVRDVVRALDLLASQASTKVATFNVGTGRATSVREIATNVLNCWSINDDISNLLHFSGHSRSGDPFSLVSDSLRLANIGFTWEIPLDQGLDAYVNWFKHNMGKEQ